jgi:16S rRNA (cytosine1402-N4)-methyltransferase
LATSKQKALESPAHLPVLLDEAIAGLAIVPEGIYVDATFGRGGHSMLMLGALGPKGRLIAFDRDPQAVQAAHAIKDARFEIVHAPFSQMIDALAERGITHIDGLLADLGVSSPQLEDAERGFSFRADGPLDMRMDPSSGVPVSAWIAHASRDEIQKVIAEYGEERFAFQIADAIAARVAQAARGQAAPLHTTAQLAELVAGTLVRCRARREPGQHPATRTFQALRIHINGELEELKALLQAALVLLREGGRLAIISFHSLEDRVVKQFFRSHSGKAQPSTAHGGLSRRQHALVQALQDASMPKGAAASAPSAWLKPLARIRPSAHELARNARARSATLRIGQRCMAQGAAL